MNNEELAFRDALRAATGKTVKDPCGCVRSYTRRDEIDVWLISEYNPCARHNDAVDYRVEVPAATL